MTTNNQEKIREALNNFCVACGICDEQGRVSESATERLFLTLMEVFNPANVAEMEAEREESHRDGMMMDMFYPIAERIEQELSCFIHPL